MRPAMVYKQVEIEANNYCVAPRYQENYDHRAEHKSYQNITQHHCRVANLQMVAHISDHLLAAIPATITSLDWSFSMESFHFHH